MALSQNKNMPKINPLSGKNNWRGIEKTTREFFRPGQQNSAKLLAKEFQKSHINREKRSLGQEIVQKMIREGRITENKAKGLMNELGYTGSENERFRKFESASELKLKQKRQERMQTMIKNKENSLKSQKPETTPESTREKNESKRKSGITDFSHSIMKAHSSIASAPGEITPDIQKHPENVWEILNKRQHPDIFPEENQKSA